MQDTGIAAERLGLTVDEVLTTTRAVRKRLDLDRPVPFSVVSECLALAQQAPNGCNEEPWRWVVVTDPGQRAAVADLYRRSGHAYAEDDSTTLRPGTTNNPEELRARERQDSSAAYFWENLHRVPVMLIPCVTPRPEGEAIATASALWSSIVPATWSFMLAARERGLGTCWTTVHLYEERAVAEVLGIPYDDVMQVGLIPVAYTKGTNFRPARRTSLDTIIHRDRWQA
ncbi:nitroreductase family protein [Streptomyces sp. NPDC048282]|uniref:nitroreductase family protein n=1 Tax=Streptomyces sp. NPDC048282 TaxID=3365528 RepID=UPI00371EE977